MLEIPFLSSPFTHPNFKNIKKLGMECYRGRARKDFPLFHLFLLPTIVKVLATNTS